jgi:nitroreductase
VEAGRIAPSASNEQKWKFIVVTELSLKLKLVKACYNQSSVAKAPAVLVICACDERNMRCGQPARTIDCSIALTFMMLEAVELGLGTCWLGDFYSDQVREILNIPEDFSVIAVAPIGYPTNTNQRSLTRKKKDEIVSYNEWQ